MTPLSITIGGILQASQTVASEFLNTPILPGVHLAGVNAPRISLKDETATPIRCFKGRGADYCASLFAAETPVIVCASAGNFGQGMAVAMARRGGKAIVLAASNASTLKIVCMRELGAEVILEGNDFDAANAAARVHAQPHGLPFVEDAAQGAIAEGAGTIGRELTEAKAAFDAIYVPVGGGALINGLGTWIRHACPTATVIGVCAAGAPAFARSFQAGCVVETASVKTIADGIAIRSPRSGALAHLTEVVDDIVVVSDAEIVAAIRAIRRTTGIAAEPSGEAGVAAIVMDSEKRGPEAPLTVICGANVPDELKEGWLGS